MFDGYPYYGGYDPFSGIAMAVAAVYGIFLAAILLIPFLLKGLGLHRMAKNAGVRHAWLALVPAGQGYILGTLAGRSLFFFRGRRLPLGWINLGLGLVRLVCGGLSLFALARSLMGMLGGLFSTDPFYGYDPFYDDDYGYGYGYGSSRGAYYGSGGGEGLLVILVLLGLLVSAAAVGFAWYSLYYLYMDYAPGYQLPLLLLGILGGPVAVAVILLTQMNVVPGSVLGGIPPERPRYNRYPGGYGGPPACPPPYGGQGPGQPPPWWHGGGNAPNSGSGPDDR